MTRILCRHTSTGTLIHATHMHIRRRRQTTQRAAHRRAKRRDQSEALRLGCGEPRARTRGLLRVEIVTTTPTSAFLSSRNRGSYPPTHRPPRSEPCSSHTTRTAAPRTSHPSSPAGRSRASSTGGTRAQGQSGRSTRRPLRMTCGPSE